MVASTRRSSRPTRPPGASPARRPTSRTSRCAPAMIDLDRALDAADSDARMLLTVHDELVLEVPVSEHGDTEILVRDVMEHVTELRVPLTVDTGFGPNWAA